MHVAFRPDLGHLTGRWLHSVTEAELHEGYEALRLAALHYHCGHWLIDSRRRVNRSLEGPEWVITRFLPEVQRALGEPLRVCFLVLPDYLSSLPGAAAGRPDSPLQVARFVDEGAANAWLSAE
ncbi:hypothetical protein [Hymenobacter sp. BRD67]|uniref:hypothetical protein n=1 Tax=Hymenobacter sp. BRD67 TaxID=2675877 RepID=UPI0015633809|nr:hypothetical protein [Hymenobacter sp. BRD67]QKG52548.1 hypothetical protein GKZ67_07980 [Hymenobacter sp. BRD67]